MKNTKSVEKNAIEADEIKDEYRFDYNKAKPNRFAGKIGKKQLMVVLDDDVATVFKTSESVNHILRSIINSMSTIEKRVN